MEKIFTTQFILLVCALISALWAAIQIFRFFLSQLQKIEETFKLTLLIILLNMIGAVLITQLAPKFTTFSDSLTFIFCVLLILTAILIFVITRGLLNILRGNLRESILKTYVSALKKEKADIREKTDKEILRYEQENKTLQEQLLEKRHKERLFSRYVFDKSLGIYQDHQHRNPYCPNCLLNKLLESPLKEENDRWRCGACDKFYLKPGNNDLSSFKQDEEDRGATGYGD